MVLYLIVNSVNGKKYVGQTVRSLEARWKQHLVDARCGKGKHLQNAIRKYGEENFSISPLMSVNSKEMLNAYEIKFIRELNTIDPEVGYNIAVGGEGGAHPVSSEVRCRISKKLIGRKFSNTHRERLRQAALKRKTGPMPEWHRKRISDSLKGRVHSLKSRKRMSQSKKKLCEQIPILRERSNNGRFRKSSSS